MKNEKRTPELLYHEIIDYIIGGYNTTGVESRNLNPANQPHKHSDIKTVIGTVSYDFTAVFAVKYDAAANSLSLTLATREKDSDSTVTMIYTMPDANTVQFKETWNGKDEEATTKSYDNRNFIGNVSIGMSYVNLILSFIENLA